MVSLTLLLLGSVTISVDGHEVKQCQYRAETPEQHIVLILSVPPWADCANQLVLDK